MPSAIRPAGDPACRGRRSERLGANGAVRASADDFETSQKALENAGLIVGGRDAQRRPRRRRRRLKTSRTGSNPSANSGNAASIISRPISPDETTGEMTCRRHRKPLPSRPRHLSRVRQDHKVCSTRDFDASRARNIRSLDNAVASGLLVGRCGRPARNLRDRLAARRRVQVRDQEPSRYALHRRLSRDCSARSLYSRRLDPRAGSASGGGRQDLHDSGN